MGRKKIEIDLAKVRSLATQGLSEEQIADSIGLSVATIARRKKDSDSFAEALKRGKAAGIKAVVNALFEKAMGGDNTAMIFWLKNRAGWKDKVETENTHIVSTSDQAFAKLKAKHEPK